jgi:hypothetical protein
MNEFSGKVIIITGGGSGIGQGEVLVRSERRSFQVSHERGITKGNLHMNPSIPRMTWGLDL